MTDDTDIQKLDRTTVERIAAGEVVERPASVVKELVENSLDADASRIDVRVAGDGTERITVSDDGVGMTEADVRAAVKQHTTSKIRDIEDLESGVGTLGFRGEALHTIGAVARMTVTTKARDGGDAATELRVEGGEVAAVNPAGRPAGTTIEVADLFYNTPARRKYLKTEATEFARINTVVTQYALANPDVAVSLSHDGREVFSTTGQGDLRSTILSVYGREVATSMREVGEMRSASNDVSGETVSETTGDGPLSAVRGYVSDPETTRSTREYLSTYVNGRYVTASAVRNAVLSAYGNQIAPSRYPFAVLFLEVDPATVDVNVHPRKMEVRFGDEDGVTAQVEAAVEDALLGEGLVRSSAPRGRSAPDETAVKPSGEQTELSADERAARRAETARSESPSDAGGSGASRPDMGGATDARPRTRTANRARTEPGADHGAAEPSEPDRTRSAASSPDRTDRPERRPDRTGRPEPRPDPERKFEAPTETTTLDGSGPEATFETLPRMRVLGQLHGTYIVAETTDGMVLVDQHAADERVNYERLRAELAGDATRQALAEPVTLELTAREAALFEEYRGALSQVGFDASRAGEREVCVNAVPAVFADALDPALLRDVLSEFIAGETEATAVDAVADELVADLACYPSVTGNTSLTEGSVVDLLSALDDCENPYACPHGRPVVIEFDREEVEARFERDYPGHAGRREE